MGVGPGIGEQEGTTSTIEVILHKVAEPPFSFPASVNQVLADAFTASICPAACPTVQILPFIVERLWNGSDQAPPPSGNRPGYFRRPPAARLV